MTKKTATPRTPRQKKTPAAPPAISAHDIAVRAFEHYCARGGQPGGELDDWLRAERELMASLVAGKPGPARGQDSHT